MNPAVSNVLKGMAAGAVGGLAGSWMMNQSQKITKSRAEGRETFWGRRFLNSPQSFPRKEKEPDQEIRATDTAQEPATQKVAQTVSKAASSQELTEPEKRGGGPLVHYAYGTSMGAIYGGVAEVAPRVTAGRGKVYGTALWVGGDEIVLPLLGLSRSPRQVPFRMHANSLAAHWVYGETLERVRRFFRGKR